MWAKKLGIFFLIFPRSGESIKDKRMRLYDKNMIEMRDGRKPVISPQLKSVSNYIDVSLDDIREARFVLIRKWMRTTSMSRTLKVLYLIS